MDTNKQFSKKTANYIVVAIFCDNVDIGADFALTLIQNKIIAKTYYILDLFSLEDCIFNKKYKRRIKTAMTPQSDYYKTEFLIINLVDGTTIEINKGNGLYQAIIERINFINNARIN
jgi:hypothetical protein